MTELLIEKLPKPNGSGSLKTWLQADAYAKRILLGSSQANPWESVSSYVNWFSQAQNLTKSHVGIISIADVFDQKIQRDGGLEAKLGNRKKAKVALRRLLEIEDARGLINEVLSAVLAQHTQPVVVSIPSPKAWLYHAAQLAGLNVSEIAEEDIEDSAAYITDLLRALSSHQISGLLLEEMLEDSQWTDAQTQYYRPILNIARHYRWSVVLRLPRDTSISVEASQDYDAVIGNIRGNEQTSTGVDVSVQFNQELELPNLSSGEFYFIEIDEHSLPEKITERVGAIQQVA